MLLSEAAEALVMASIAEGLTAGTVNFYRTRLADLIAFLGDRPIEAYTIHDLRRYAADLQARPERYVDHHRRPVTSGGLAPATVAGYLRAVKHLFRWLTDEGMLPDNPARRLKLPKQGRHAPKAINLEDFEKLLAICEGDDPVHKRDKAIMLFLLDTGCRAGGLVGLRLADLDLKRGRAWVTEKNDKTRAVFVNPPTVEALTAWLAVRPQTDLPWVFLGALESTPAGMTPGGAWQALNRRAKQAGVEGRVNPHSFRHAFAREWIMSGGDMGTLSDVMGHKDVSTTWQAYAIFLIDELQQKHKRHSPIANRGKDNGDNVNN